MGAEPREAESGAWELPWQGLRARAGPGAARVGRLGGRAARARSVSARLEREAGQSPRAACLECEAGQSLRAARPECEADQSRAAWPARERSALPASGRGVA